MKLEDLPNWVQERIIEEALFLLDDEEAIAIEVNYSLYHIFSNDKIYTISIFKSYIGVS